MYRPNLHALNKQLNKQDSSITAHLEGQGIITMALTDSHTSQAGFTFHGVTALNHWHIHEKRSKDLEWRSGVYKGVQLRLNMQE